MTVLRGSGGNTEWSEDCSVDSQVRRTAVRVNEEPTNKDVNCLNIATNQINTRLLAIKQQEQSETS